jgi:hypothetical protein
MFAGTILGYVTRMVSATVTDVVVAGRHGDRVPDRPRHQESESAAAGA